MRCVACQSESPPGAAFCGRCAAPLGVAAPAPVIIACVSGPDRGKRLAVGGQEVTLGRAPGAGLVSDDPEAGADHAGFVVAGGWLHFRSRGDAPLLLDGAGLEDGTLALGQQLRVGGSYWQVEAAQAGPARPGGGVQAAPPAAGLFDRLGTRVGAVTGVGGLDGFRAGEMFSSLRVSHSEEETEEHFIAGTPATTPTLREVQAVWPKPWVFFKVFLSLLAVYVGCAFGVEQFQNPNFLPGLMVVGSFAIPLSALLFLFEMNVPRNVSIYQVFKLLFIGGTLSLIVSLFGYSWSHAQDILGAAGIGIIEEVGKVAALWLVVNNRRYPWTLNGLLLGGAVGAGFAGFESAGYAFKALLGDGGINVSAMFSVILLRGVLAPGGHVAWAALNGAALWKVKGDRAFSWEMLQDWRFLRVFLLTVVLHDLWDTPLLPGALSLLQNVALTVIALVAVLGFVQDGITQVQRAQTADATSPTDATPTTVSASTPEAPATSDSVPRSQL